jgi:thiaminase/transcriptional activator TenA
MKNSRGLIDHESLIRKHNLSRNPPAPGSLFFRMWNANRQIAEQSLATGFLQGIKEGNLKPTTYGAFTVSDIYYCSHGAADYGSAASRATDPILRDYLVQKQFTYDHYNHALCATWSLSGPQSVVPTSTALKYSTFERSVANGTANQGRVHDPIYALIVMIPCEYLWAWLAAELAPPSPGNLYADWITANSDPAGAFAMGNFLETYISQRPIDERLASEMYGTAMQYEYRNFTAATESISYTGR